MVAHAQREPSALWMTMERPSTDMGPERGSVASVTNPWPVPTKKSLAAGLVETAEGALSLPHLPERSPYSYGGGAWSGVRG
jgi:hypothetical protein